MKIQTVLKSASIAALAIALAACDDDDTIVNNILQDDVYNVTITNLTHQQPLAPAAIIVHDGSYSAWTVGQAASEGLEILSETGDPNTLISEAQAHNGYIASTTGAGITASGTTSTYTLRIPRNSNAHIAVVTMPVNTNDAFVGATAALTSLVNVEQRLHPLVWDAGTEANSETAATVPGLGGHGLNILRDDRNFVALHPGIISVDDGLATSGLNASHKFDQPAAKITITRTN